MDMVTRKMRSPHIAISAPWPRIAFRLPRWLASRRTPSLPKARAQADLARRDFVREMQERNPDAFSSDLDVQQMMALFPDKF